MTELATGAPASSDSATSSLEESAGAAPAIDAGATTTQAVANGAQEGIGLPGQGVLQDAVQSAMDAPHSAQEGNALSDALLFESIEASVHNAIRSTRWLRRQPSRRHMARSFPTKAQRATTDAESAAPDWAEGSWRAGSSVQKCIRLSAAPTATTSNHRRGGAPIGFIEWRSEGYARHQLTIKEVYEWLLSIAPAAGEVPPLSTRDLHKLDLHKLDLAHVRGGAERSDRSTKYSALEVQSITRQQPLLVVRAGVVIIAVRGAWDSNPSLPCTRETRKGDT